MQATVDRNLLSAGARRFQRTARHVQPDVNGLDQLSRNLLIVVFEKDRALSHGRIVFPLRELLQHELRTFILRMSFAGKNKLHRTLFVIDQTRESRLVRQQKIPTFVGRNASRKTDRQRLWIKHRIRSFDIVGAFSRGDTRLQRALPYKCNKPLFQLHVRLPQLLVRNSRSCLSPRVWIAKRRFPNLAHKVFQQVTKQRRDPRRSMNSVGDVTDRNLFELLVRPELLPQRARNFTVFTTHTIRRATHSNREWRESITFGLVFRLDTSQSQKLILRQTKLSEITRTKSARDQRCIKRVIAGRNRRVRRENTLLLHKLHSLSE